MGKQTDELSVHGFDIFDEWIQTYDRRNKTYKKEQLKAKNKKIYIWQLTNSKSGNWKI